MNTLFQTAFDLFTGKGFAKTTVSDIVNQAGLAKGTFYLYFKDKYDLRDKLIAFKASQLFDDAHKALDAAVIPDFEEEILFVTDYIIERFQNQQGLMKFLSKNLSWGVFQDAVGTGSLVSQKFYNHYLDSLQRYHVECSSPKLLLFTLIEFISSTSYNCILHNEPVSMEESGRSAKYILQKLRFKKRMLGAKALNILFFSFSHVDHFVKTLPDTENLFTDNLKQFLNNS